MATERQRELRRRRQRRAKNLKIRAKEQRGQPAAKKPVKAN